MPPTLEGAELFLIASLVASLVSLCLYVWYGWALSRLFPQLGAEGWKGWVPFLNEVVILQRGGAPGWAVILYFLPIVNLYGLYLKWVALSRLGEGFGRGRGVAVLGIFLPPVWATILASDDVSASDHYGERIQGMMTAPGPALPSPPRHEPALLPDAVHSSVRSPSVPPPPMPEPEPVPDQPSRVLLGNPWAPKASEGEASGPAPDSGVQSAPVVPPVAVAQRSPVVDARADVAELPTIVPSEYPGILDAGDDELDRTVVVDRRPVVQWSLLTETGVALRLTSGSVILGRRPASSDAGVELITVPDETRTLSKNHARLDLRDDVWTVTDLHSTNGVILVSAGGGETQLVAGGSAPLSGEFVLGKVSLRLVFENGLS